MGTYIPTFLTIRETAKTGVASEYQLRCLEKQGKLPGVRSGNRFKVNLEALVKQLNEDSKLQENNSEQAANTENSVKTCENR